MKARFKLAAGLVLAFPYFSYGNDFSEQSKPCPKRNVLFIIVDDLNTSVGCFGDQIARTPILDSIARKSNIYTSAYCQQAVSGPSRASILTGTRPDKNGVTELNTWMREKNNDIITMPQHFKENGYKTISVGKVFHGSKNSLDSLSWSTAPSLYSYSRIEEYMLEKNQTGKKADSYEFSVCNENEYFDTRITNKTIQLLDSLSNDTPFFLAVGFLKPHLPFCAPSRFWDLYEGEDFTIDTKPIKGAHALAYHNSEELRGYVDIPKEGDIPIPQQKNLKRAYYSCISYIDENIGILIDEMTERGLMNNTIVVILGDHGYHTGDQGLWCKSTNYEDACRAPLIIYDPSQKKGNKIRFPVEFIDIFPTVCDMAGIHIPLGLDGKNLSNRYGPSQKFAISQFVRPYKTITRPELKTHTGYALRTRKWTYIEWFGINGDSAGAELYKRKREKRNIAESRNRLCRKLSVTLKSNIEK